jgi:hypothetical protein
VSDNLPEPVGFRARYRSEPGMIGHYPWTYADQRRRLFERPSCEYEDLYTSDQMLAFRAEGVAAERERCASVAENYDLGTPEGHAIAACIRRAKARLGQQQREDT